MQIIACDQRSIRDALKEDKRFRELVASRRDEIRATRGLKRIKKWFAIHRWAQAEMDKEFKRHQPPRGTIE